MILARCNNNLWLAVIFLTCAWAIAMATSFFLMRTIRKMAGHDNY